VKIHKGISPNQQRKLSEVLLELMNEIRPTEPDDEEYPLWVDFTILLWNIGALPREAQGKLLFRLRQKVGSARDPLFDLSIASWLELRRTRYPDDRRVALDWEIVDARKKTTLQVVSADLNRLENQKPEKLAEIYQEIEQMVQDM